MGKCGVGIVCLKAVVFFFFTEPNENIEKQRDKMSDSEKTR